MPFKAFITGTESLGGVEVEPGKPRKYTHACNTVTSIPRLEIKTMHGSIDIYETDFSKWTSKKTKTSRTNQRTEYNR